MHLDLHSGMKNHETKAVVAMAGYGGGRRRKRRA